MFVLGTLILLLLNLAVGQNKVLNFPTASSGNYISYSPSMPALSGFTVCSWQKKISSSSYRFWWSYASSSQDNEILLGEDSGACYLFLGGSSFSAKGFALPQNEWYHYCVAWDSTSGQADFYLNGVTKATLQNVKKGYSVRPSGNLVIAQDQDRLGGGFDGKQAFVGQLSGITLWNYALSSNEIAEQFKAGICSDSTTDTKPIISYGDIISRPIHGAASLVELEGASCTDVEGDENDESDDESIDNVLNFPTASSGNYISYSPGMPALSGFTVCSWQKKISSSSYRFWWSYASSSQDNEILLGEDSGACYLFLGGSSFSAKGFALPQNEWYHYCVAWDSTSGQADFYLNGVTKATLQNVKKGYSVRPSGNLVIAQDQDKLGGGFDGKQAFVGQLFGITLWNYALSSNEIAEQFKAGICSDSTTDTKPIISYGDIISRPIHGAASLVKLEGASCKDTEAGGDDDGSDKPAPCDDITVNEDCWTTEQKTEYKRKKNGNLGNIVGTVEEAKLACSVLTKCKALTCSTKKGKSRCELRSSTKKSNGSKKKTSYIYTC